ncbi:hypothetical protein phytr_12820 [Candidatus Phycorickettsia trachydisci]|uniref:Uncharacterized protein n=1 Tax=Candidatus Phycorickettsia trachydisci TaxID=2115978 RepID=A0A2P1P9H1_9RICK|nr:hypothetical protein [Candidatus Phycorickettsia trachydisci]AVP87905.1 hypothetical protein phytr_9770 [Candidatus Phycorickettsia trachydisci]AVP88206.1 hypothetical protein phytr_12820 [Candidatus Phycorickettsia trachydisci]
MMRKLIPTEVIEGLYYELANLSPRHPARRSLIENTAKAFNVSLATVRRAIKKYRHPYNIGRSDYNTPRKISKEQMLNYCELIAALKMRSTIKKVSNYLHQEQ